MLVRLPRAPVLSGGLRRKTQLSPVPSTWPPPPRPHLTSPKVLKVQNPAPSARFSRKQSVVSSYQSEKPSDTTSFHSVLVCHRTSWQKNKDKWNTKARIEHKRKQQNQNIERNVSKSNEKNVI
ncbi:hypothetical protein TNCV_4089851 [Trichonephila clavipes]|nr:hypothetical protein TNCV_4089851 [Trichonephila clavipes]